MVSTLVKDTTDWHTRKRPRPLTMRDALGGWRGEKRDRLEAKASLAECCAFCVSFLWTPQQSSKRGCFKEQKHSLTVPQARGQRSRRQRGRALCEGPRGGAPGAGPCCLVGEALFPRHLSLAEAAPGSLPLPCRQASDPLPVPFNDVNCFRIIMYGQRRGRWVCLACAWPWTGVIRRLPDCISWSPRAKLELGAPSHTCFHIRRERGTRCICPSF